MPDRKPHERAGLKRKSFIKREKLIWKYGVRRRVLMCQGRGARWLCNFASHEQSGERERERVSVILGVEIINTADPHTKNPGTLQLLLTSSCTDIVPGWIMACAHALGEE